MFPTFVAEPVAVRKFLENKRTNVKMSTLKPLVPIVAITLQSNSATTIIPPFLHDNPRGLCFVGVNARHHHRGQCCRIGAGRG
jgi:hypothetical protein